MVVESFSKDPYDLALLVTGILLLLVGGYLLLGRFWRKTNPLPYVRKDYGSAAQRRWLPQMNAAFGGDYDLQLAVRLEALLAVDGAQRRKAAELAAAKLGGQQVDFVLLEKGTLEPQATVLLQEPDRSQVFCNAALLAAGLPVLLLPAEPVPAVAELRSLLQRELTPSFSGKLSAESDDWVLGRLVSDLSEPEQWSLGEAEAKPPAPVETPVAELPSAGQWPPCPECGSPRMPRRVNRGRHAGRYFLVCQRYPTCQQLQPLKPKQLQ